MSRHAYTGRCQKCGEIVEAVIDGAEYRKVTARALKEMVMQGLTIERVNIDETPVSLGDCRCNEVPALFDETKKPV